MTEKTVEKAIKSLKMKKSSGADSLSQEQLKLGIEELVKPLTKIINQSIKEGKFPENWKKAIVTPILKKGSTKDKNNYRPVSCLMVLSKVLEKIVCSQITDFMEQNDLLPENQHGFREHRSTMSAHANIAEMEKLQITQNKMARVLENVLLKDRMHTSDLLNNQNMLSVNQISAQIKLTEIWKATNIAKFPIKVKRQATPIDARVTRGVTNGKLVEEGSSNLVLNSFIGDATRLWNRAPEELKSSKTLYSAKTEIKKFVATLPI